jgi:DNA-binding HxlR family transcriptional regulator
MANNCDTGRSGCPVASALDLVGDRWTLLVIRDLMLFGRHEFRQILQSEEGIASNILSDRLKKLIAAELVAATSHPTNKTKKLNYLTPKGKSLIPIVIEMILWGDDHGLHSQAPKESIRFIREHREAFVQKIMQDLDAWEKIHLP